jgi:biotin operon repressor
MRILGPLALSVALSLFAGPTHAQQHDWTRVDEALGRPGTAQPGGVMRYSFPRSDLQVTVDGLPVRPALALGGWLAFQGLSGHSAVMGDLVLTEDEINPVMTKLLDNGIDVTAIHNHLLRAQPQTMYMHVSGNGDAAKLAGALREALALTKIPASASAPGSSAPTGSADAGDFPADRVGQILGHAGRMNGGVYQVSVPRAEPIRMMGMDVPDAMGTATAINFQPTGSGKAATTGDFVLLETEVEPVLKALRQNGIEVTALHSHMLMEEPRLFFMHFWANDDPEKLARGLKAALDQTNARHG